MMSVISVEQRGPVTFLAINRPEKLVIAWQRGRRRRRARLQGMSPATRGDESPCMPRPG